MPDNVPLYLQIADELRDRIQKGELAPGQKLPSETDITKQWGVSRMVAKSAVGALKAQGLVEGVPGSGVYVRAVHRLLRDASGVAVPAVVAVASNGPLTVERASRQVAAVPGVAARLGVEFGAPVLQASIRVLAGKQLVQVGTAWQLPGSGLAAAAEVCGVLAVPGADEVVEDVTVRPATREEIVALRLPARGAAVLCVYQTTIINGRIVQAAEFVMPADRYTLRYRVAH